jgi:hypothetical protein
MENLLSDFYMGKTPNSQLNVPPIKHWKEMILTGMTKKISMIQRMGTAWKLAKENLKKAQAKQKVQHDRRANVAEACV